MFRQKPKQVLVFLMIFASAFVTFTSLPVAVSEEHIQYWIKASANDAFHRSLIADTGASIEVIREDYVMAFGSVDSVRDIQKLGLLLSATPAMQAFDFPKADQDYHNYSEMEDTLFNLNGTYPQITQLNSIGTSTEGRTIWDLRISGDMKAASQHPGIFYVGGHHSREHLSVEIPLKLAEHLLKSYVNGDARIKQLLDTRDIHIVPAMNPDGLEFDISTGTYQYWRKNRRNNGDRTYGVDLNRNYGYKWGTGGSSNRTNDETYMGPSAFSEPETRAIRDFVEKNVNINIILSFHTFSQLILYPWGHSNSPIGDDTDRRVHETMAQTMSKWNGYSPQTSSSLYIASGDLTDWAYGAHKIVSFTFELDPQGGFSRDGFYPGAAMIQSTFQKNLEPALYLLSYADDPRRVLQK